MFTALSFILATYIVVIVAILIIRKRNKLPWSIFFLFNIAISIGYIILSLTVLEDVVRLPTLQPNITPSTSSPINTHFSILTICLLGIANALMSLGFFIFFIARDAEKL